MRRGEKVRVDEGCQENDRLTGRGNWKALSGQLVTGMLTN